jgi:hypothetical protein
VDDINILPLDNEMKTLLHECAQRLLYQQKQIELMTEQIRFLESQVYGGPSR